MVGHGLLFCRDFTQDGGEGLFQVQYVLTRGIVVTRLKGHYQMSAARHFVEGIGHIPLTINKTRSLKALRNHCPRIGHEMAFAAF